MPLAAQWGWPQLERVIRDAGYGLRQIRLNPTFSVIAIATLALGIGKVAVVTGGTFGVGRGIASGLAQHGARVFVTGRSAHDGAAHGGRITCLRCDHRMDTEVTAAFERVAEEAGKIEILVNNVWGGYERMVEDGVFTWSNPFWEQGIWRWDAMFSAGVRAHYYASQLAAKSMVASRSGLIVNISFWAAQKHIANVAYGTSKAATDKMTVDMAVELQPYGVTAVFVSRISKDREGHGGGTLARP